MTTRLAFTFARALALGLTWTALSAGCRGETSKEPQIVPIRNMYHQQRYNPQARSAFFEDGRTMRKPVEHTFAREMIIDAENVCSTGLRMVRPSSKNALRACGL